MPEWKGLIRRHLYLRSEWGANPQNQVSILPIGDETLDCERFLTAQRVEVGAGIRWDAERHLWGIPWRHWVGSPYLQHEGSQVWPGDKEEGSEVQSKISGGKMAPSRQIKFWGLPKCTGWSWLTLISIWNHFQPPVCSSTILTSAPFSMFNDADVSSSPTCSLSTSILTECYLI